LTEKGPPRERTRGQENARQQNVGDLTAVYRGGARGEINIRRTMGLKNKETMCLDRGWTKTFSGVGREGHRHEIRGAVGQARKK